MDGTSHISDGNPNVLNANRNGDGHWVNAYYGNPDNQWNDNGAFAFPVSATLFTSRPASAGLSFNQLAIPPAEHPTNLINLFRHGDVFLVIKRLCFPEHHQQYFNCINFPNG